MSRPNSSVTGNVIEHAPAFGIMAGWGKYLRDVVITGNVIRKAFVGVGVSVASGAGTALVSNNVISEAPRGAVVGLDHARPVTPDLTADGAQRFAQVMIGTNSVRKHSLALQRVAQQRIALLDRAMSRRERLRGSSAAVSQDCSPDASDGKRLGSKTRRGDHRRKANIAPRLARPAIGTGLQRKPIELIARHLVARQRGSAAAQPGHVDARNCRATPRA